jgi:hypothetical protein
VESVPRCCRTVPAAKAVAASNASTTSTRSTLLNRRAAARYL